MKMLSIYRYGRLSTGVIIILLSLFLLFSRPFVVDYGCSSNVLYKEETVSGDRENFTKLLTPHNHNQSALNEDLTSTQNLSSSKSQNFHASSVCDMIGNDSALTLWNNHLSTILSASKHPLDGKFTQHNIQAHILKIITPRLFLGQKSVPRDWKVLHALVQKVNRRLQYLRQGKPSSSEDAPPPLRVAVLGGSVTMGVNCWTPVKRLNYAECSWPNRFMHTINRIAGGDVIVVENLAQGGTNSGIGKSMLEFDLLSDHIAHPDVVVNAYSTNDMHVITMNQASSNEVTMRDLTFEMNQDFARVVLNKCMVNADNDGKAVPPLLLYLDDYLGNEQHEILKTTEASQGIQVLANYYGFGFVSYADVVRDFVYGTTNETVFSPAGWYKGKSLEMTREVHPQAGMHVATSFLMAFYALQLVANYCQMGIWKPHADDHLTYETTKVANMPALKDDHARLEQMPNSVHSHLPPWLSDSLSLETVSDDWRNELPRQCSDQRRCPVSWMGKMVRSGIHDPEQSILDYVKPYWVQPSEWQFKDDTGKNKKENRKYGFFPNKIDETDRPPIMTLDFSSVESKNDAVVKRLTVFYLKSYGEKWEKANATVRVQTTSDGRDLVSETLKGSHEKKTSELSSDTLEWNEKTTLSSIQIQIEGDKNGATFKLLGMAICSH